MSTTPQIQMTPETYIEWANSHGVFLQTFYHLKTTPYNFQSFKQGEMIGFNLPNCHYGQACGVGYLENAYRKWVKDQKKESLSHAIR